MKIQVHCRRAGDPRTFLVGARVRVTDGREFVLRHDPHSGNWRLACVNARR